MKLYDYLNSGKTYIIAEMSGNHGGSFENALKITRAAHEAGADCLKIQTYTPDTITLDCDNEYFKITQGPWKGYTRYSLYVEGHTPWEWQGAIKAECDKLGMDFMSSAFDLSSVDFLESIGTEIYKIASLEIVDIPLLRRVAQTGKPVIMSTGIAKVEEIREALETIKNEGNPHAMLLKCTSEYPALFEDMNLRTIPQMKQDFHVPVGLSDHSLGHTAAVTAVALGAQIIEKHFCITREEKTVDSAFSMNLNEFKTMVEEIRNAEKALGIPTYEITSREQRARDSRRSLFASADISKGEKFSPDNIKSVRPGQGLHTRYYDSLLGKVSKRDLKKGDPLTDDDL